MQALANNLLSRAALLSRHAALGPEATVCCAVAIAELQLRQACRMLTAEAQGGAQPSLAVALLAAAYQQLTGDELQAAAASAGGHAASLAHAKHEVR